MNSFFGLLVAYALFLGKLFMKIPVFLVLLLHFQPSVAQTIEGSWYGSGIVNYNGVSSSYLSELQLKQKGDKVTGEFNYYFKSGYFKNKITGTFDKKTKYLSIRTTPVIYFQSKSIAQSVDCTMEGDFRLIASKTESTLSGSFMAIPFYKYTCPEIKVKFKKGNSVAPLEKYVEDIDADNSDIIKNIIADTLQKLSKDSTTNSLNIGNVEEKKSLLTNAEVAIADTPTLASLLKEFNEREFEEQNSIIVDSPKILVYLYDNGQMDHDSISLFFNRKLLVYHKELSDKTPITLKLEIDTIMGVNELSMFAQNLGDFPPNTALMIIYDGEKRYEFKLTSTLKSSATIRIRKKTWKEVKAEKELLE